MLLTALLISCEKPSEVRYQGYVEGENIFLASPYSGILVKKLTHRGQVVKKNQLLFQLDSEPQILQIKQARAELNEAQRIYQDLQNPKRKPEIEAIKAQIEQIDAQLELAQIRVARFKHLHDMQAGDRDRLDQAIARYDELKHLRSQYQANLELAQLGGREEQINAQLARIKRLQEKLAETKWQLAQKSIYAPESGIIFDTFYLPGEFVASQQPIAALLTPKNVRIEFFVPAERVNGFNQGQIIEFTCMGCKKNYTARVSYISPEAEYVPPLVYSRDNADKLVFRIKAQILQPDKFKPGQPVTVMGIAHD